jgi:hypothetical protein
MMNLVNGYVCANCTDVELAKRGVDPAHPQRGPEGAKSTDERKSAESQTSTSADDRAEEERLGKNRPLETGIVGTKLNLLG